MVRIVRLEDVHKVCSPWEAHVRAMNGVAFSIERGDFMSIAGLSGSEKSTVLKVFENIELLLLLGCAVIENRRTVMSGAEA